MSQTMQTNSDDVTQKILTRRKPPVSDERVRVVIYDLGISPYSVAEMLRETVNLTVTDLEALEDSMPLVLFEEIERKTAETLRWQFQLVGALIQLHKPRQPKAGNPSFFMRKSRPPPARRFV